MTNRDLDRAIDDVARRMTAQQPPADLRGRVLDRIGERARPERMWRLAAVAACGIAIAAIGYTLAITREAGRARNAAAPATVAAAAPAQAAATSDPGANGAGGVLTANQTPGQSAADRVAAPSASAEELAWLARAVPAIEQPAALGLDAIQPEALTIHQIDVKPLVTEPLSVSPADAGGAKR